MAVENFEHVAKVKFLNLDGLVCKEEECNALAIMTCEQFDKEMATTKLTWFRTKTGNAFCHCRFNKFLQTKPLVTAVLSTRPSPDVLTGSSQR